MTFHKWGSIFLGLGTEDPRSNRAVIEHGGLTTTIVAVPDRAAVVKAAVELVEDGAQLIELCGAFGPVATAQVINRDRWMRPQRCWRPAESEELTVGGACAGSAGT
jgi:hypothetical protein